MKRSIEVDDEVFEALQLLAEPFVDTPNSVLRRALSLPTDAPGAPGDRTPAAPGASAEGSDRGKRRRRRTGGSRAPSGSLLPESAYRVPILCYLRDSGGRAPAREAVAAVGEALDGALTSLDREATRSGGVRWQSRVQFARLQLAREGLLESDSPRGVWEITDRGLAALAAQEGSQT